MVNANLGRIAKRELVFLLLLLVFTVVLYYPSLSSGFLFDDWAELEHAKDFQWRSWLVSFSPLSGLWRPMFYLFWATVFKTSAINPFPYHAVHLGFHLLSVVTLWILARRLLNSKFAALAVAFLFAVHKVNANSVIWNSGATDTLAVTFVIPALCCYVFYRDTAPKKRWLLVLSCVLYYLGLKSKLMAVTLPILLVLYELCLVAQPLRAKAINTIRLQWPYWVISAVYLWAFLALGLPAEGAYKPVFSASHFLESVNWYLSRILFDINPSGQTVLSILFGATLILAIVLRNRQMVFGWFWFLISLGPVAPLAAHRFETHLYLPIIGSCIYVAALIDWFRARMQPVYAFVVVAAIASAFLYINLPHFRRISGFMLTTWGWSQSTLDSLKGLLPAEPSGSHIFVYPRPDGALFDSGSSVRLLYHLDRTQLRVTVAEDKGTIRSLIQAGDAGTQPVPTSYDPDYYDPKAQKLYVFEYSKETRALRDVTSDYRSGSVPGR